MHLKNGDFHPASTASTDLTRTEINKSSFSKRLPCPLSIICHIGDLCTCFGGWEILESVQGDFRQFLLKLVKTGFCSASKQPNLQTKKRYCRFYHQDVWTEYFFILWHCGGAAYGGRHGESPWTVEEAREGAGRRRFKEKEIKRTVVVQRKDLRKKSFASRIQDPWNSLSDCVKLSRNPKAFRTAYRKANNLV